MLLQHTPDPDDYEPRASRWGGHEARLRHLPSGVNALNGRRHRENVYEGGRLIDFRSAEETEALALADARAVLSRPPQRFTVKLTRVQEVTVEVDSELTQVGADWQAFQSREQVPEDEWKTIGYRAGFHVEGQA